jgi:uncharacterized membrane protein YqjE
VAAAVYSGACFAMANSFAILWIYITNRRELFGVELSDEQVRRTSVSFLIGNPFYAIAVVVSFISAEAVLVIIALLAVYYMVAGMRSPAADNARARD